MSRDESYRNNTSLDYGVILDSISDALFALNPHWEFIYVNRLAAKLLETEVDYLIGKCIWDAFPRTLGSTFDLEYHRALETQTTVEFQEYYHPLSKWFVVRACPISSGLAVFFQDVTQEKLQNEQAKKISSLMTQAQNLVSMGIWEWDIVNNQIYWSDEAREIGKQPSETGSLDLYLKDMVYPDDLQAVGNAIERSLLGEPYDVQYRFVRPDGQLRFVHSRGAVFYNPDGRPSKMIGLTQDITQQKETESLLRESQQRYESLKRYNPIVCETS